MVSLSLLVEWLLIEGFYWVDRQAQGRPSSLIAYFLIWANYNRRNWQRFQWIRSNFYQEMPSKRWENYSRQLNKRCHLSYLSTIWRSFATRITISACSRYPHLLSITISHSSRIKRCISSVRLQPLRNWIFWLNLECSISRLRSIILMKVRGLKLLKKCSIFIITMLGKIWKNFPYSLLDMWQLIL